VFGVHDVAMNERKKEVFVGAIPQAEQDPIGPRHGKNGKQSVPYRQR
jgi:hypothetical protein